MSRSLFQVRWQLPCPRYTLLKRKVDIANEWWRPIGSYGVTFNTLGIPWAVVAMACTGRGVAHLPTIAAIYATTVTLFAALYGIRQYGKKNKLDAAVDMKIAGVTND